jgi:hypothetical protein
MKGQAFSTFKILIGAVFATALLVIIYTVVTQIAPPYSGYEATRDLLLQAQKAPGLCFSKSSVAFVEGEDLSGFGVTNIPNSPFNSGPTIIKAGTLPVSIKCTSQSASDCTIWINKPICP